MVGILRQGIVRTAADDHTRPLLCDVPDGIKGSKIYLLLQRISSTGTRQRKHIGIHGDGVEQALGPLVKIFEDFFAQTAFLGGLLQKLLIVKRNTQLLGHTDAHFLAAAAKLPANGDNGFHKDSSSLGIFIIPRKRGMRQIKSTEQGGSPLTRPIAFYGNRSPPGTAPPPDCAPAPGPSLPGW